MDELVEAVEYLAGKSPQAADDLFDNAIAAAESLTTLSERGRLVPELDDGVTREIFVGMYRLLYQVTDEVAIVAIVYGPRDFIAWWRERS